MLEISIKNEDLCINMDKVNAYNDTISEKLIEIDKQLAETQVVFEDKMVDFDPLGVCLFHEKVRF